MPQYHNMGSLIFNSLEGPQILDSDTLVYMVYKQGYMDSGVHGLDVTIDGAIQLAKTVANNDGDSYHSYDVYAVPLDRLPGLSINHPTRDFGWMNQEPLFSTKKSAYSPRQHYRTEITQEDNVFHVIYRQSSGMGSGVLGVSKHKKSALSLAKKAISQEPDDFSYIGLYAIPIGKVPSTLDNYKEDFGWMNSEPIFSGRKQKAEGKIKTLV